MTEAERLNGVVAAQAKEINRLRRLLSVVRVAHIETNVVDKVIGITITAVGIDELHFIESAKAAILKLVEEVYGVKAAETTGARDTITRETMEGVSIPRTGDEGIVSQKEGS